MSRLVKSKEILVKTLIVLLSTTMLYFGISEVKINEVDASSLRINMNCDVLAKSISSTAYGIPSGASYEFELYRKNGNNYTLLAWMSGTSGTPRLTKDVDRSGTYMAVIHVRSGNYQYANATCSI